MDSHQTECMDDDQYVQLITSLCARNDSSQNSQTDRGKDDQQSRAETQGPICVTADRTDTRYKECPVCLQICTGQADLDAHLELMHSDLNKETQMKQPTLGSDSNYDHDSQNRIQCTVCEKTYGNMTEYTHHLNTHLLKQVSESHSTFNMSSSRNEVGIHD